MAKILTTREIIVHLRKGPRKLERATTKHVDASIRVEQPKNPQPPVALSTTNLPDVSNIVDKKKRDDIMAERKLYEADQKKLATAEKKPWKEMTDEEKKIAIKERTAKMMATKARKKREREERRNDSPLD